MDKNLSVFSMLVYTVLIQILNHCWGMERDLRGSLTRETESKTQATNQLILKSPSENKICSPHPPQDEKKINETSNVDIDTTLTGGFATEAVIMPFGSMDLKCRDKWGQVEKDEIKTKSCEVIGAINEIFHKRRVNSSHTKLPLLSCCWHSLFFHVIEVVGQKQFYIWRSCKSEPLFLMAREYKA